MDISKVLESYCWSIICENHDHGDDSSISWVVVGYFQARPHQRVIGMSDELGGVKEAIGDALSTVKVDSYAYLYEYKVNR